MPPRRRPLTRAQRRRRIAYELRRLRFQARRNAALFEGRREFWGRPQALLRPAIIPSIQGAHRWHSYNWYLRQLHLGRGSEL